MVDVPPDKELVVYEYNFDRKPALVGFTLVADGGRILGEAAKEVQQSAART
jgi:hypothetical protein